MKDGHLHESLTAQSYKVLESGQHCFLICIMDLKPVGSTNHITKYTDDASLLVPETNDADLERKFLNVMKWANDNKLMVNMAKTKEIVFQRPNARNYLPPAELSGIERVMFAKMLGVWLQDDIGFRKHIDYVMHICNQRTYLLTQLKSKDYRLFKCKKCLSNYFSSSILYRPGVDI